MRLSLALSSSPCVSAHLLVSPPHCAGRHNIWMCDPEGSGLPVHPECAAGTHNKDTNKKARLEKNQSRRIQRKQWSVEPPVKTIFFWGFSPAVNFIYNHLANTEERPPIKAPTQYLWGCLVVSCSHSSPTVLKFWLNSAVVLKSTDIKCVHITVLITTGYYTSPLKKTAHPFQRYLIAKISLFTTASGIRANHTDKAQTTSK